MIDSQTTLILAIAMLLVTPVVVWLILPRQEHRAKEMWCLGSWMAGAGLVLIGFREMLPVPVTFHLANALILGFFVCNAQSFRMMLGVAWTPLAWWFRILWGLLFYSSLYAWAVPALRGGFLSLTAGGLGLYVATLAWRLYRHSASMNALGIACIHLVTGFALAVHSAWIFRGLMDPSPFTWDASPIAMVVLLLSVLSAWCFVGMALEVAALERLQVQKTQQASRESHLLNQQLTQMDRQGQMAIVSGSLAHELNQPLTAATMNVQLAQRLWATQPVASPMLYELLDQIETGVGRAVRILQRIRQGHEGIEQHHERVELQALLERALKQMASDLERARVRVMREWSQPAIWCLGDELALSQVIVNLLRNAIQATQAQPEHARQLWVCCAVHQGQAQWVVRDSGPGMSTQLLAQWGQPFESTRSDGLGLGLAISRAIVLRHQGQLELANSPQGGLQATVSLPLAGNSE
jgi:signal transduction histidine kinase